MDLPVEQWREQRNRWGGVLVTAIEELQRSPPEIDRHPRWFSLANQPSGAIHNHPSQPYSLPCRAMHVFTQHARLIRDPPTSDWYKALQIFQTLGNRDGEGNA